MSDKQYLGDSVYVERIDGMIRLTTEDGLDITYDTIWLEPDVMNALIAYYKNQPPADEVSPHQTDAPASSSTGNNPQNKEQT